MRVKLIGHNRLRRRYAGIILRLRSKRPIREGAKEILRYAIEEAPIDTGELRQSHTVEERGGKEIIGPTADHAFFVIRGTRHTRPNPYLGRALRKARRPAVKRIADEYRTIIRR